MAADLGTHAFWLTQDCLLLLLLLVICHPRSFKEDKMATKSPEKAGQAIKPEESDKQVSILPPIASISWQAQSKLA